MRDVDDDIVVRGQTRPSPPKVLVTFLFAICRFLCPISLIILLLGCQHKETSAAQREGGERYNRPILAKYIGGSRNCICGACRARVWTAELRNWSAEGASECRGAAGVAGCREGCPLPRFFLHFHGKMAHFGVFWL